MNDRTTDDVILCAVSSVPGPVGIMVPESHPEYRASGFIKSSRILPCKIFTTAKVLIKRRIGTIGDGLKTQISGEIRRALKV
jgi:hypothetical protein